jgi:hypothetical protein
MHRPARSRRHIRRRTRARRSTRSLRPRPLEDGTTTLHSARRRRGRGVDGPRSGLRHDHATRSRTGRRWRWRGSCRLGRLSSSGCNDRRRSFRRSRHGLGCRRSGRSGLGRRSRRLRRRNRRHWSRSCGRNRGHGRLGRSLDNGSSGSSRWGGNDRTGRYGLHRTAYGRRTSDHSTHGGLAGDRRSHSRRGSHNVSLLPGQRYDPARRGWRRSYRWGRSAGRRNCAGRSRGGGHRRDLGRSRGGRCGSLRGTGRGHGDGGPLQLRRGLRGGLGTLPLEDGAKRVAGLRDMRQIEPGLSFYGGASASATAPGLEVVAYSFGLVDIDGTGVRLSGHADRFQRIQNRLALYFQFSCQIVDSNLGHPSLFVPRACQLVISASSKWECRNLYYL